MFFAKFSRFLTACSVLFVLSGCAISSSTTSPENYEAMKARANLALAYLEQGDFAKAKENIEKAFLHNSQDYLPYSVAAYYYQQLEYADEAAKFYQKAITLSQKQNSENEPSPDVLNNYGTFLCEQGQFSQAYSQFERVLQSKQYYQQADTLENIVLCAIRENNLIKQQQALKDLAILDSARAAKFVK